MNTSSQAVETQPAEAAGLPPQRKPFNYYPLLGLAVTILCAVLVYGAMYFFMQ